MILIRCPVVSWLSACAVTVFPFVFYDGVISTATLKHEGVHWQQQRRWAIYGLGVGLLAWWALYLLALPVGWNPWRRRWETEAYRTQGCTFVQIRDMLQRRPYYLWWM
jgi:hypothetical protein